MRHRFWLILSVASLLRIAVHSEPWHEQADIAQSRLLTIPLNTAQGDVNLKFTLADDASLVSQITLDSESLGPGEFGCDTTQCVQKFLSGLISTHQGLFLGKDKGYLGFALLRNSTIENIHRQLSAVCGRLRLNEGACEEMEGFVLGQMLARERLCVNNDKWAGDQNESSTNRKRILVTSVPRSGNGWVRRLLTSLGPDFATRRDCGREHRVPTEAKSFRYFVAKSHYPFDSVENCGCREPVRGTTCIVRLVRNPLDNHAGTYR